MIKEKPERGRPCKKTVDQIVREFFPDSSKEKINFIVYNKTGFPGFWNIPKDGKTVLQCFRKQLRDFKKIYGNKTENSD